MRVGRRSRVRKRIGIGILGFIFLQTFYGYKITLPRRHEANVLEALCWCSRTDEVKLHRRARRRTQVQLSMHAELVQCVYTSSH